MATESFYKLVFYVPDTHTEETKAAVFAAGAGRQGDYECCAWQCRGTGQFRPGAGATPFLGTAGEIEKVPEDRVETLVVKASMRSVIAALKKAHPYEEPAFEIIALVSPEDF